MRGAQARRQATRRVPLVLVLGVGASMTSVLLFGVMADEVLEHESMAFDTRIVEEAREMRSPALDRLLTAITDTGEPWAMLPVTGLVALRWARQGRTADAATAALALLGGAALNGLLKTLFHRQRPALQLRRAHATGYSFPSGHSMTTLATYGTLAYLVARRGALTGRPAAGLVTAPVLALCALVGWSRVYLEVHYPTDVVAGWAAATVWLTTCGLVRGALEPEES